MRSNRIVVGVDGSPAGQHALEWAVWEAARRRAPVLVVTAWPEGLHAEHTELITRHRQVSEMQRHAIEAALAGVPAGQRPVLGREVVLDYPVPALARAAEQADLLVLGSDARHGLAQTSVAGRIARRFVLRHGGPCPLVVIPTPPDVPPPVATAPAAEPALAR
jgi:nucleotide-binding universal stress UspA family protein